MGFRRGENHPSFRTGEFIPESNNPVEIHYHRWSCGARTKIEKDAFVVIPCSAGDNCHILKAAVEQGELNGK